MNSTIARHFILTKANPELVVPINDLAPADRELIVYGGVFDGASVRVARKFAEDDGLGYSLPWTDVLNPALDGPLAIDKAGAGFVFSQLARAGWLRIYLASAGNNTAVMVGIAL